MTAWSLYFCRLSRNSLLSYMLFYCMLYMYSPNMCKTYKTNYCYTLYKILLGTVLGPPGSAGPLHCRFCMKSNYKQGSHASLKVLESNWLFSPKFKALKVLENRTGAWTSMNFIPQVLESPWIHQVKLCNISSSVKQVFCLKQDLLIIVTFCFYQLKLSRNHRNRYYMLL